MLKKFAAYGISKFTTYPRHRDVKDCRNNVFITLNGKTVYSRDDVATSDVGHNAPLLLYSPQGITIIDCLPY